VQGEEQPSCGKISFFIVHDRKGGGRIPELLPFMILSVASYPTPNDDDAPKSKGHKSRQSRSLLRRDWR